MDYKSHNEYHRNYQRLKYQERRNRFISSMGGVCTQCGCAENLVFDHVDPDSKVMEVSRMMPKYSDSEVAKELNKCQLLCQECHIKKTALENSGRPAWNAGTAKTHGSYYGVYTLKCRCPECSKYRNERLKKRSIRQ